MLAPRTDDAVFSRIVPATLLFSRLYFSRYELSAVVKKNIPWLRPHALLGAPRHFRHYLASRLFRHHITLPDIIMLRAASRCFRGRRFLSLRRLLELLTFVSHFAAQHFRVGKRPIYQLFLYCLRLPPISGKQLRYRPRQLCFLSRHKLFPVSQAHTGTQILQRPTLLSRRFIIKGAT